MSVDEAKRAWGSARDHFAPPYVDMNAPKAERMARIWALADHHLGGRLFRNEKGGSVLYLDEEGTPKSLPRDSFQALVQAHVEARKDVSSDDPAIRHSTPKRRCNIPRTIVRDTYAALDLGRPLAGIMHFPCVLENGEIIKQPGYHPELRSYLHWTGAPADPHNITDAEADDVLRRLTDVKHASVTDYIHHLAALLWWARGPALAGHPSPMVVFRATERDSGKSMASSILMGAGGQAHTSIPWAEGRELGYRLAGALGVPRAGILFDNIPTGEVIGGAVMHQVLTARGPLLLRQVGSGGGTPTADPTRMLWAANGNQLGFDTEVERRILRVDLEPRARPDVLPFRTPDLFGWVKRERWLIASALLRIVVSWHDAGCPPPPRVLPSFEKWSRLVGGPIAWWMHGRGGELFLHPSHRERDPADADMLQLLEKYWPRDRAGRLHPRKAGEVQNLIEENGLHELSSRCPRSRSGRSNGLGRYLRALASQKRPFFGWRFFASDRSGGRVYWAENEGNATSAPTKPMGQMGRQWGIADPHPERPHPIGPICPIAALVHGNGNQPPKSTDGANGVNGEDSHPEPIEHAPLPSPLASTMGQTSDEAPLSRDEAVYGYRIDIPEEDVDAHQAAKEMIRQGVGVDPALWQQVTSAALDQLHQDLREKRDEGVRDDDLTEERGRIRSLMTYRDMVLQQALIDPDNRVRSGWRLQGPGRMQTVSPNLQGITKKYGVRSAVVPRVGHRFVVADWTSAHMWIAAGLSGSDLVGEMYDGHPPYEHLGQLWGPELDLDEQRAMGKVLALAALNGGGEDALSRTMRRHGVDPQPGDGRRCRDAFLDMYPALKDLCAHVRAMSDWTTPQGRHVVAPSTEHSRMGWYWQSYEADALRMVLRACIRSGNPPVLTCHDEIVWEVAKDEAETFAVRAGRSMDLALARVSGLNELMDSASEAGHAHLTVKVEVRESWAKAQQIDEDTP